MPPVPSDLLKARIAANRARLYGRLLDTVHAFDLEDLSLFTEQQRDALKRAWALIHQIQKPLDE